MREKERERLGTKCVIERGGDRETDRETETQRDRERD